MPNPETPQVEANEIFVLGSDARAMLPFSESKASQLLGIGEFWAIEDRYRDAALANLAKLPVADCVRFAAEADERQEAERVAAVGRRERGEPDPKPYQVVNRTAILNVRGTMTKKSSSFSTASTIRLSHDMRAAEKDADVDRVLMIFETPGGECRGCAEFADQIRETNAVKPIFAYIEDMCASAGYYAASQCTAIYMNRMGFTGCIGTLSVAYDYSGKAAMQGIKVLKFASDGAGTYKGACVDGTEITPAHQAYFQGIVDHYGNDFKDTVQAGRTMSDDHVKKVADGRLYNAADALALGLIDGVCSLDECLATISAQADETPAATTAHDPARATSAATEEKPPMKLSIKEFLSRLGNVDKDALAKAGLEDVTVDSTEVPEAAQTTPVIDAATQARLDQLEQRNKRLEVVFTARENQTVRDQALSFWNRLITPDEDGRALAKWNQRQGVISTFVALAAPGAAVAFAEDGTPTVSGSTAAFDDATGEFSINAALKGYMDSMLAAAPNDYQKELIAGAEPRSAGGTDGQALDNVLGGTMVGRSKGDTK